MARAEDVACRHVPGRENEARHCEPSSGLLHPLPDPTAAWERLKERLKNELFILIFIPILNFILILILMIKILKR